VHCQARKAFRPELASRNIRNKKNPADIAALGGNTLEGERGLKANRKRVPKARLGGRDQGSNVGKGKGRVPREVSLGPLIRKRKKRNRKLRPRDNNKQLRREYGEKEAEFSSPYSVILRGPLHPGRREKPAMKTSSDQKKQELCAENRREGARLRRGEEPGCRRNRKVGRGEGGKGGNEGGSIKIIQREGKKGGRGVSRRPNH